MAWVRLEILRLEFPPLNSAQRAGGEENMGWHGVFGFDLEMDLDLAFDICMCKIGDLPSFWIFKDMDLDGTVSIFQSEPRKQSVKA